MNRKLKVLTDTSYIELLTTDEEKKVESAGIILEGLLSDGPRREDTIRGIFQLLNEIAIRQLLLHEAYTRRVDFEFRGDEMFVTRGDKFSQPASGGNVEAGVPDVVPRPTENVVTATPESGVRYTGDEPAVVDRAKEQPEKEVSAA